MTKERWISVASIALIFGGAAWISKLVVIIATEGRVTTTGAAGTFFSIGLVLLLIGSTGVGFRLITGEGANSHIAAVFLSLAGFITSFMLLQGIALALWAASQAVFGVFGPAYAREEAAILITALAALSIGAILLRSSIRRLRRAPAV